MVFKKLNDIKQWQAFLVIVTAGLAIYAASLHNNFIGDDLAQIVNNVPVHSIKHIKLFFEGGTFYNGQGLVPLSGVYFRPLMVTLYSLLYTVFGSHAVPFHTVQLALCIGSSYLLFLFLRYSLKPVLALILSLVFLIHPLNSQIAFSIPALQDALYFFFGILALWVLIRFNSNKSLIFVIASLTLSIFAKETGFLFIFMALAYLYLFNRERLIRFSLGAVGPVFLYVILKINAVGLSANPANAPIDNLSLIGRLMNTPEIVFLYISKFIMPWKLSSAYYWIHPKFSVEFFLLPLTIDLLVLAAVIFVGLRLRDRANKANYYSYLFFATWCMIGLAIHSQVVPLDMTVCENWFYFSMAGALGMVGVALQNLVRPRVRYAVVLPILAVLLIPYGVRTIIRGTNWYDVQSLASHDISASPDDYIASSLLAGYYFDKHDYSKSQAYAEQSVKIFPTGVNENYLGESSFMLKNYQSAYAAYVRGMDMSDYYPLYDNFSVLTPYYGNVSTNRKYLEETTKLLPNDIHGWFYLAILEYENHNVSAALADINNAYMIDSSDQSVALVQYNLSHNLPLNIVK